MVDHSSAAQRASDAVNLHVSALGFDACRKWVAVRLADGRSDGTLYDTKRDAVRHQSDEQLCAYVCVPPGGMTVCQAESVLAFHRRAYDAGFRLIDPDHAHGGLDHVRPLTVEQAHVNLAALTRANRY
jgi:hypothetical protein